MTIYTKNPPTYTAMHFHKDQTSAEFVKENKIYSYSVHGDTVTFRGHSFSSGHWLVTPVSYPLEDEFVVSDEVFDRSFSTVNKS